MIDNIFGHFIDPEDRLARTLEDQEGVKHLQRRIPLDPIPGEPLILTLSTGGSKPYDSARCLFTTDGSDPASGGGQVLNLAPTQTEWSDLGWRYIQSWSVDLPPMPARTLIRYHLAAHSSDDNTWVFADNQAMTADLATDFALWIDDDPVPEWASRAIVYQIFLDRFNPGGGKSWNVVKSLNDFYGGTLRGVIDKLDYIQALGFNTIWLSPFLKTTTHHGYNASDYYRVEPRLGSLDDLRELIQKGHDRGLRLLMDFVANHWSKDHATFQDALNNPESPYHDWYLWNKWPDDYEAYFRVKELPKLNLRPGPAREYLLEVARYWLQEGFDGFRLDFAYGPPHDFWVDFRRACRAVKPDCWIFGEVVHTAPRQRSLTGVMDGTLDFLLARALRETFAFERMSLSEFEAFLGGHEAYFPANFSRPAFLDNHDMSRFLYIAGDNKEKLKVAALVLYTLSGVPVVYNGTEAGVTQERPMQQGNRYIFEEARLPMRWDGAADADLMAYFSQLGRLRHQYPMLSKGSRRVVILDSESKTYAYLREDGGTRLLVAINLNPGRTTFRIKDVNLRPEAIDWLNKNPVQVGDGTVVMTLPGYSGAWVA